MTEGLKALNALVDVVLAYRPKPKIKKAHGKSKKQPTRRKSVKKHA